ncbi:hypothetical protein XELAEV_18010831mg [Xenopus laevis]|uniref:Uncharacterized protein n=1 Tax=Xenopus laevis TaxID=8355 RepID=A0A974I2A9_XENLA|nr:hypothetical protein XELAEV_18010831mg [Xenopus laevis]
MTVKGLGRGAVEAEDEGESFKQELAVQIQTGPGEECDESDWIGRRGVRTGADWVGTGWSGRRTGTDWMGQDGVGVDRGRLNWIGQDGVGVKSNQTGDLLAGGRTGQNRTERA